MYKGIPASPGIVIGPAYVLSKRSDKAEKRKISASEAAAETERFKAAVEKTRTEIMAIRDRVVFDIGNKDAEIFNAYILLLKDQMFVGKAEKLISEQLVNSEYALSLVLKDYEEFFSRIADSYLREKLRDINGLVEKILANLSEAGGKIDEMKGEYIVVASDLSPADTADMDKSKVLGFITETGGATSHTAIVARSLEIPAVVGVRDITKTVKTGDTIVLDGEKGIAAINPPAKVLAAYREERKNYLKKLKLLRKLKTLEAVTLDGHKIKMSANIEFPEETSVVKENNADGIGLFRSEFIYIKSLNLPGEEEQFNAYRTAIEKMSPKPVTIRTLDIGGDKFLPYFKISPEQNPFLGLRAIRLSLVNINIFKTQLRAILRASAFGTVKIMFPMISTVEEIEDAKRIVAEVMTELSEKKVPFDREIKIGIMIEVPSAALMADELAKKCDFFSVGTNDLIQYTLAVDRGNENVARYYDALNPAVLRLIKKTTESAHRNGITTSVCGEMAGTPQIAFLLAGLGVDELSVSPASILSVKQLIRRINFKDALETADAVLKMEKTGEIRDFINKKLSELLFGAGEAEKEK
ncbi:MAG TPA: phosphoenolpyruvate--protein phosphotransferase [Candidatus Goldiibacteriota bacterium]|nr:phosphoenolpyruvate--protein phosphotransferase [Candidatus Goldiibacteriota bacterium]